MWVCSCVGVNERGIRAAAECGAYDLEAVGAVCGAGTQCGGCHDEVRRVLAEVHGSGRLVTSLG